MRKHLIAGAQIVVVLFILCALIKSCRATHEHYTRMETCEKVGGLYDEREGTCYRRTETINIEEK